MHFEDVIYTYKCCCAIAMSLLQDLIRIHRRVYSTTGNLNYKCQTVLPNAIPVLIIKSKKLYYHFAQTSKSSISFKQKSNSLTDEFCLGELTQIECRDY